MRRKRIVSAKSRRRVCFVTGTRAEFGLMRHTLLALKNDPRFTLQLLVTGMHLDASRGRSMDAIAREGWKIDAVVPWEAATAGDARTAAAIATGSATAKIAAELARLRADIVLVVGDRVEAFAGAAAGHLSGRIVAHVHGGDRAMGLVDDSLRHAITKLAHVHFPATRQSAGRIIALGEDRWRVFRAGSPGLDGIRKEAAPFGALLPYGPTGMKRRGYGLLVLHPQSSEAGRERDFAAAVHAAARRSGLERWIIVYPNNDPGSQGIAALWEKMEKTPDVRFHRDVPRRIFLGLMRDAAVLAGNSSSGIIEAASFGTPVLDIGWRQSGRERGDNVHHVAPTFAGVRRALRKILNQGQAVRYVSANPYGTGRAARTIVRKLATIDFEQFGPKLIAY